MSEAVASTNRGISIAHAAVAARHAWLEQVAMHYGVAAPDTSTAHKRTLNELDAMYAERLQREHGFSPEQIKCHLTNVRVKLFEWAERDADLLFALPEPLSAEAAQTLVGIVLLPLLELSVYDDLPPFTRAVLATLASDALATLVAEQRLLYGRAQHGFGRSAVAIELVRQLGEPQYQDGIHNLLAYLRDDARWRRCVVERAVFTQSQGRFIAPIAAWYQRPAGAQHHDGSHFLIRLLGVLVDGLTGPAAGNLSAATASDVVQRSDRAVLRQVWQQLAAAPTT